jgi:chaperonin GroES
MEAFLKASNEAKAETAAIQRRFPDVLDSMQAFRNEEYFWWQVAEDAEGKSAGGIIIPDTAKEKPTEGEVIAVGPGGRDESGKLIPIDLRKGDRVLFGKWSGTEVKIDGIEYLIMKESDIMGVVEQTSARKNAA